MNIDDDDYADVLKKFIQKDSSIHISFSKSPRAWCERSEPAFKIKLQNIMDEELSKTLSPPWLEGLAVEKAINNNEFMLPIKEYLNYLMAITNENIPLEEKKKIHKKYEKFLKDNPITSVLQMYVLSLNVSNYLEHRASLIRGQLKNAQNKFFREWSRRFFLTKKLENPKKCSKSWAAKQIKKLLENDYPELKIVSEKTIREIWLSNI